MTLALLNQNPTTDVTFIFVNNIFWEADTEWCPPEWPLLDDLQIRYNCFWPYEPEIYGCELGFGNMLADPLICEVWPPGYDWRLDPDSPCLGRG